VSVGAGIRLGPYEITAKLGEGGMGEVWRATDTKLKREVALKVLPADFTEDRERLARFEREAQLLAQLHHPNIASIFGLEESGGIRALVMELVEGPTLAERMAQGALPVDESLSSARQIAEALEAAHEKGIVHRDLKPQNIKTSREGSIKVLDFGLAKAMDPMGAASGAASASQLAASPTLTLGATIQGVILGTAAYMAPEQARGGAADKRADIWAFGVVLFEMLTGRSMFAADTVSDTLAGVLRAEIDLDELPAGTPPAIRRLLRRCLERNAKNRLHDIADARIVIDDVLMGRAEGEPAAAPSAVPAAAWKRALPWAVAALAAAVALVSLLGREARPEVTALHADLGAPEGNRFHFQGDLGAPVAISPDGSTIAFGAAGEDGITHLWVRSLATGQERLLAGTDGASAPFFSPDGRTLAYFAQGSLLTVGLSGGAPLRITAAPNGRGGAWSPDGTIVFAPDFRTALVKVRASGGATEPLTAFDAARHSSHRWPALTPDGRAIVYVAINHEFGKQSECELRWVRLDGTDDHALVPTQANGAAVAGRLLYLRDRTLLSQPFDAARGVLSGEPAVVASDVLFDLSTWRATFAATAGRLVYSPGGAIEGTQLSRVDRSGRVLEELAPPGIYLNVDVSPDGKRLAVGRAASSELRSRSADIWMLDLERKTLARFTFEPEDELSSAWSPDGKWLYYGVLGYADRRDRIFRKAADGGGVAELVYESDESLDLSVDDVSPDGRRLYLSVGVYPFVSESRIAFLELDGSKSLKTISDPQAFEQSTRVSPDGRWMLFTSTESGDYQMYVRAVAAKPGDSGARWQISTDGGYIGVWSADGSEIIYLEPSLNLSRVTVAPDGAGGLRFGAPEQMFATTLQSDQFSLDRAPDGQSLFLSHFGDAQSRPLRLVDGWQGKDR